jgi:hypothetical protein
MAAAQQQIINNKNIKSYFNSTPLCGFGFERADGFA